MDSVVGVRRAPSEYRRRQRTASLHDCYFWMHIVLILKVFIVVVYLAYYTLTTHHYAFA